MRHSSATLNAALASSGFSGQIRAESRDVDGDGTVERIAFVAEDLSNPRV